MTILLIKSLVGMVIGFLLSWCSYRAGENYSITRANERILSIMEETEKFNNKAQGYMDECKEVVKKHLQTIEKQNHLIEMLKMKLRDK